MRRLESPTTAIVLLVFRTFSTGSLGAGIESAINFPSDAFLICLRPAHVSRPAREGISHFRHAFPQKHERSWESPSSASAERLHRAGASLPKSFPFHIRNLRG